MRTTVNIDDNLLGKAKSLAAERHQSLGQIIEEALRSHLYATPKALASGPTHLKTFGGQGLLPGVDLDDNAAMLDVMESR